MRQSSNIALLTGLLVASTAAIAASDPVEESVVTRDSHRKPTRPCSPPEQDEPVMPVSRQHRRAMERSARKRLSTTQGDRHD